MNYELASGLNFRDLGGLPTGDGRTTRPGVLFRAGAFADLTAEDATRLHDEVGLRFVFDLRGGEESAAEGRGALGAFPVVHVNLPLMDFSYVLETGPGKSDAADDDALMPRYLDNLERDPNLVAAVDLAAHAVTLGPAVLHCAFGKDRTGSVVALLLRLVGVTEDAVIADYMASAPHAGTFIEGASRIPRYKPYVDRDPSVFHSQEETIRRFLAAVEHNFGGAEEWATAKGITAATIAGLRSALLDN
jgi:protein tyrosine/serine phosphatase